MTIVKLKRGTAASLFIQNPLLEEGEFIYELDTRKLKIGSGYWNELPYIEDQFVTKITGKNLSTEDYTTADKNKLANLTQYTNEDAQDAIASLLAAGTHTGITYTYDDANNKINSVVTAGGGGSSITRYEAGAGTGCYVLATGTGVVITKTGNTATFSTPAGVQIISASIHFLSTDIGSSTNATIDFGIDQGAGDNSSYAALFAPQFQCWADVAGNRAQKSAAVGNLNPNSHALQITSLSANQAIWVNLSF
jgi:hypothetical protein